MNRLRVAMVLSVFGAGCMDSEEIGTSESEAGSSCPTWMCGGNSPVIAGLAFHELNMDGLPNLEGFKVTAFKKNNLDYTITVTNGVLSGHRYNGFVFDRIHGSALVGAEIWLSHLQQTYILRIEGLGAVPMYAENLDGQRPSIETYKLRWLGGIERMSPICTYTNVEKGEGLGQVGTDVIFTEGDRINAKSKTVTYDESVDNRWFNIGCAGHAIAKMHLTGHTKGAQAWGYKNTVSERQTILKMFSGDYCGTGTPFTVAGTPLLWRDDRATMQYTASEQVLEARWTPHGASCLGKPRILWYPSPEFPDIEQAIAAECKRPPPCSTDDPNLFEGHHILSAHDSTP